MPSSPSTRPPSSRPKAWPEPVLRPDVTRGEALAVLCTAFAAAGLEEAALDARVLLCDALAIEPAALAAHPERPLGEAGATRLAAHAARRLAREPVSRILGHREFWGMAFEVSPDTLVPRPDSETVVEAALRHVGHRSRPWRVLDLGTGTGCLLLALLSELPHASGIGIDRSEGALAVARRNASRHGLAGRAAFVASDWAAALSDSAFDLLVANPPYIASDAIAELAPEVQGYEPRAALDGGADGLCAYRAILADAGRLLAGGALAVLEIGFDQAEAVPRLAQEAGLDCMEVAHDLGGNPRAVALKRPLS